MNPNSKVIYLPCPTWVCQYRLVSVSLFTCPSLLNIIILIKRFLLNRNCHGASVRVGTFIISLHWEWNSFQVAQRVNNVTFSAYFFFFRDVRYGMDMVHARSKNIRNPMASVKFCNFFSERFEFFFTRSSYVLSKWFHVTKAGSSTCKQNFWYLLSPKELIRHNVPTKERQIRRLIPNDGLRKFFRAPESSQNVEHSWSYPGINEMKPCFGQRGELITRCGCVCVRLITSFIVHFSPTSVLLIYFMVKIKVNLKS